MLTLRALNRALLARQMLLARERTTALDAIKQLVGLQAQQARPPFIGLWSRVEGFRREDLTELLTSRKAVRATLMRATLHLMSSDDYLAFRPVLQPMLSNGMKSVLQERANLPLDEIVASAREIFTRQACTFTELRGCLSKAFPAYDERAMGYAVRTSLPLVSTPDSSIWAFSGDPLFTTAECWLGSGLSDSADARSLVLRYLKAFGPATVADVQAWSGMQGLKPVLDSLRPQLVSWKDSRRREYFDVPDAPRPEEDIPAPPRLIAGFDNLVLAHADRSRIIADEYRQRIVTKNLQVLPTFLVDGFVAGTWKTEMTKGTATLTISPFQRLPKATKTQLLEEAESLIRFAEPEASKFAVRLE